MLKYFSGYVSAHCCAILIALDLVILSFLIVPGFVIPFGPIVKKVISTKAGVRVRMPFDYYGRRRVAYSALGFEVGVVGHLSHSPQFVKQIIH